MNNKLERKYGLFTAICMVVGIVIGSGVFFKAQTILQITNGDMPLGVIAWLIGGAIMLACILTFAGMSQKYEKVNGIVDYAEATVGPKYGYYMGWFLSTIYYPSLTAALAWLSARYTLVFLTTMFPNMPLLIHINEGGVVVGPECIALMLFYLCCSYAVNALSPKLAGKIQASTTVIKLIPLGIMAIVGVIAGLVSGQLTENFVAPPLAVAGSKGSILFAAVCATSFAYEGWIIATTINSELKNSKRNLPKALTLGGIIVIATYLLYYIGVTGGASNAELIEKGATVAFTNIFGNVIGNFLNLFIAISCIGTMNGLMLACCRGVYSPASMSTRICPTTPPSWACCCAASGACTSTCPTSPAPGATRRSSRARSSRASPSCLTRRSCRSSRSMRSISRCSSSGSASRRAPPSGSTISCRSLPSAARSSWSLPVSSATVWGASGISSCSPL